MVPTGQARSKRGRRTKDNVYIPKHLAKKK